MEDANSKMAAMQAQFEETIAKLHEVFHCKAASSRSSKQVNVV